MVKRIYQIADIHIPTYQKMEMFVVQLEKLLNSIEEDVNNNGFTSDEVRIVICGDLVHSKNTVSNELNVLTSNFIRNLSNIAKVYCIAGNHDLINSNTTRIDTLTGIFQTAQFDNAIFLDMALNYQSGIVYDDNITFALYSYFDDFNPPDIMTAKNEKQDNTVIGLYHGTVIGSKLYNGFTVDFGADTTLFDGCDCVMAGHIHQRQTLHNENCDIVYAGSPIQQNYGESLSQHGYVVWDVETLTHQNVDIDTDYGYYKIRIDSIEDIINDKEVLLNY